MAMTEATARLIAQQKLAGKGMVLRSGPGIREVIGWRFAVRMENEPDEPYDGYSMAVMVLVVEGDELIYKNHRI